MQRYSKNLANNNYGEKSWHKVVPNHRLHQFAGKQGIGRRTALKMRREKDAKERRIRMEYSHGLCERLIAHFTFAPGDIPPGFSGFREKEGLSLAEFRSFLGNEEFRAAAEEAEERLREILAEY